MLHRFFNLLYVIVGAWIAVLILGFHGLANVLSWQIVLILMAAPLAVVVALRYLAGPHAD